MKYLEYTLFQNGYINRFIKTGVFSKESPYSKATLSGRVNEWLVKGPSIHDHPDRVKAVAQRTGNVPPYIDFEGALPGDEITCFEKKDKLSVYFPFGNTAVEDSSFYRNPAFLRCYGFTYINIPSEETAGLLISTCGALTLWVNDELITDYSPLERNVEHSERIEVTFKEGLNKIVVCLEDLAERDTDFRFRLRYLGLQDVKINLPVRDETDLEAVYKAEKSLSEMYFDKDAYVSEQIWLNIDSFSDMPIYLKILSDRCAPRDKYLLNPGEKKLLLLDKDEIPSGFCHFMVIMNVSGLRLSKVIGTYSFKNKYEDLSKETYAERKELVADIIAKKGGTNEYSMVVNLDRGTPLPNTDEILRDHLAWIVKKQDCSDFRMIIVAYVYANYRHLLSEEIIDEIEKAILEYRYWIDEPGDDVMWFFSENHAILFHVSEYIAGTSMPDATFTVSGLKGEEVVKKAEKLLNEWFDTFFDEFVTEWNSSTYVPVDVTAVAYLYDFTKPGTKLHEKAKKALDMLALSFAVNEHKGNILTSFGRTYEKELKGSYSTGMPSLLFLWFNAGHMNETFRALTPLVLGDYEPPKEYEAYTKISGGKELIERNTQGIDKYVNLYLYKNSETVLSTAVEFNPYKKGYQENIVTAAIDGIAQVFINHPGETMNYGSGRPGLWAGNGCLPEAVQHENVSILRYRISEDNLVDYTHAYAPLMEFDEYVIKGNAIALRKGDGYIGLKAQNGLIVNKSGPCRDRELISPGRENVWVVKVGKASEYKDINELITEMDRISIEVTEKTLRVKDRTLEYVLENKELHVNGKKAFDYPMGVIETPIVKGL